MGLCLRNFYKLLTFFTNVQYFEPFLANSLKFKNVPNSGTRNNRSQKSNFNLNRVEIEICVKFLGYRIHVECIFRI
jgi:hypothetical protein